MLANHATGALIAEASLPEDSSLAYNVHLDTAFTGGANTVEVRIASSSSACTPTPAALTFTESNFDTPQSVTVSAGGDLTDQGVSGVFALCSLVHSVASADTAYSTASTLNASLAVTVPDDDTADSKIRPTTTSADGASVHVEDYRLKFLGPLTLDEGASDQYGLQLDTTATRRSLAKRKRCS